MGRREGLNSQHNNQKFRICEKGEGGGGGGGGVETVY